VRDPAPEVRRALPLLRAVAWLMFGFFAAPIRVVGRERVPKEGPILVIVNHRSNCDPVVTQYASPRHLRFLARRELFQMGLLGRFVAWFRAVPVSQATADVGAIKAALERLKDGHAVAIYPEGALSPHEGLLPILPGVALLAVGSGVPCVCLGLKNTDAFMPYALERPRWAFRRIVARWGEPRTFGREHDREAVLEWVRSELERLSGD
jgi:1-acyl-sn-glycerol-3-phosphate acyltransferase